jgi:ubiquinol-cytochrome c reductase iron-sulfur subunit
MILLRLVARFTKLLVALIVLLVGIVRRPQRRPRIVPEGEPDERAEWIVVALLLASAACALAFVVFYALDWSNLTQWLGLALGSSLGLLAAALIVTAKRLVVEEEITDEYEYPEAGDAEEQEKVVQIVSESDSKISRRRLLGGAGALAGTALGAALLAPAGSLGPILDTEPYYESPWRRGRRLVDDKGEPYAAEAISEETFYTAFPEGADPERVASPLVVVRLDPAGLKLPTERTDWAPNGILAFSKVCTHAGCAVALYRSPLYPEAEPGPALVCPCHYSTFDPAAGGEVTFGPAGRDLPQLPLAIDGDGNLVAAGNFSGPPGPSFWGVRTRGPQ